MASNELLNKAHPLKAMLALTIPSMFAQFVNILYGVVDKLFIANMQSGSGLALAGVGICAPITTLITSFTYLICQGASPLFATRLGQKDYDDAKKIMANSFLLLVIITVVLMLVFLIFKKPLLYFFGATPNNFEYASDYITIYVLGTFFCLMSLGLNSFITCQGKSTRAMVTVIIGALTNILLDYIFIFPFNMGVKGAALATIIAQAASALFAFSFLISNKSIIKMSFKGYSLKYMKKIMKIGFCPFIITFTDSVILIVMNKMVSIYADGNADLYLTINSILLSFFTLISMPFSGISLGGQPFLSYNYGASEPKRVRKGFIYELMICYIYGIIMFIISMFYSKYFIKLFILTKTEEVQNAILNVAPNIIRWYCLGVILLPLQWCCVDTLVGLGHANRAIIFSLIRKILTVIFTVVFPIFLGTKGCYLGESVSDIISSTITTIGFVMIFPKILKIKVKHSA